MGQSARDSGLPHVRAFIRNLEPDTQAVIASADPGGRPGVCHQQSPGLYPDLRSPQLPFSFVLPENETFLNCWPVVQ